MTTGIGNEWDPGDPKEVTVGIDIGTPGGDHTAVSVVQSNGVTEHIRIYTRAQVCDLLGMNHSTLARWEQKGLIPIAQRINNICVYSEEQFEKIKTVWENSARNISEAELCSSCKRRKARRGSTLCSRCSYSALETSLRSTLPGMVQDDAGTEVNPPVSDLSVSDDAGDQEITCPKCGSDDPQEKKMITSGPEEFPISLECDHEWHNQLVAIDQHAHPVLGGLEPGVKYYSRREIALLVGVSPTTICRWEIKGELPPPLRVVHSNQLFYTEDHLQKAKNFSTLVAQSRVHSPLAQAARGVSSKSFSRITEKAVSIKLRGVGTIRKGGLL